MKRLLALLLSGAIIASGLTGCNDNSEDNSGNDVSNGETTNLTLWSISTESDAFHTSYLQAIKDFEDAHPGVKVKFETFENEAYKTKLTAAVTADELPDVFFSWAGGFSQPFAEAGKLLALDDYYSKYESGISKGTLVNNIYDGKLYGSSINVGLSGMWYNKKLLNDNGIAKVPETIDELKTACQVLITAGITPIATSAKDTWVLAMLHDGLTLKSAGHDTVTKTLTKQEGASYNSADFIAASQALKDLKDMGAFINGADALSNDEASAEFYAGKAAFYFTGSWMAGSIQSDVPEAGGDVADYSVAPIPVINGSNAKLTDFMGGSSESLMVSAATDYPDLAAALAFEITRSVSKYGYLVGAGVPAWKIDYEVDNISQDLKDALKISADSTGIPQLTQDVAKYATEATSFTLWFDTLMQSEDAQTYLDGLNQLFAGTLSPEDFAAKMETQLSK